MFCVEIVKVITACFASSTCFLFLTVSINKSPRQTMFCFSNKLHSLATIVSVFLTHNEHLRSPGLVGMSFSTKSLQETSKYSPESKRIAFSTKCYQVIYLTSLCAGMTSHLNQHTGQHMNWSIKGAREEKWSTCIVKLQVSQGKRLSS